MNACTCPQTDDYRQLDRGCPTHGDVAERARRTNLAGVVRYLLTHPLRGAADMRFVAACLAPWPEMTA